MNLRMSLLDAVHRNEELSEILLQKDQQLEQQDKTSRAQARVIKVTCLLKLIGLDDGYFLSINQLIRLIF